jgi:LemA protein
MDLMLIIGLIVLLIVVIILLWFFSYYNRVIRYENRIDNAWAQIDVQLKRRADLIPNLMETVNNGQICDYYCKNTTRKYGCK